MYTPTAPTIYEDWTDIDDPESAEFEFVGEFEADIEEEYGVEIEYLLIESDLIPEDDMSELASRMVMVLSSVTLVTVGLIWLLVGGFRSAEPFQPQTAVAQAQAVNAPILVSQPEQIDARAGDAALSRSSEPIEKVQELQQPTAVPTLLPTATPFPTPVVTPIPPPAFGFNPGNAVSQNYVTDKMHGDLDTILYTDFPARDYLQTHLDLTALAQPEINQPIRWQLGQRRGVNVVGERVQVKLVAASSTAYIWVDTRLSIPDRDFIAVANRLDGELYPAMTALFGVERQPGIDGDPRFHIFHLARLESRELGFFDSSDAYPQEIFAESNEHEAIYINMDNLRLGGDLYYGTLVHELQHLIQWNVDRNESTWLDEGLSQLSEVYAGFNSFSVDNYTRDNDIQLNSWSYASDQLHGHYGGSALFFVYLWEQFGDGFIRSLSASRYDGMAAVASGLQQTAGSPSLESVVRDWLIAVYLNDPQQAEPKYGFSRYEFEPPVAHQVALANGATTFSDLRNRPQFSGWYVELPSNRTVTISFAGDSVQPLFPIQPGATDGRTGTAFYVPPRNRIDATLQKSVDLRGVPNPSINFDVWHGLEDRFDHAYLMVSADGGANWEFLPTDGMGQGTYGPGFSGDSAGWLSQSASLEQWSGLQLLVQFKVLTDSAVPANGFAIDNIEVVGNGPAVTFEFDDGGWTASGFVRSGPFIPQRWVVSVVQQLPNGDVQVQDLDVDRYGELQQAVTIGERGTLVIAPVSASTSNSADFWFSIQ